MPATAILDVQGLCRRFGSTEAVAGVDLHVAAGETVALLGPNGAGKSTTLAMILGLLSPTAGQVTIGGRAARQAVACGLVGAMLQSGAGSGMPPGTRVGELVGFVASLYPAPLSPPAVLRHAGLASLASRKIDGLSGGELQRVRFALAICPDPRLLILDEPTVGLDVPSRRSFWETVRAFAAEGRAVLFATHYLAEAAETAGRVVVLHKGRVVADGTVDEIRRTAATRRVRFHAPDTDAGVLRALPAVQQVRRVGGEISLDSTDSDATVRGLVLSGTTFTDLEVTGAALEDAFLALTCEESA
ncbi:MAG TPA: ABC transporter ATP-binding protein [Streptosporangiaceae bacterium]|nr:ABC transporter ATP-binding protein [Streptosporangiaceae bacterium]